MWLNWGEHMSKDNFISTFFHGKYSDSDEVKIHIENLNSVPRLYKVITASTIVERLSGVFFRQSNQDSLE